MKLFLKSNRAITVAMMAVSAFCVNAETIFVAPGGDDAAPGPKTKPVASISRALQLADSHSRVIRLAPGTYELAETVMLSDRNSGLRLEAEDSARPPVLSAGRRLSGWEVGADGFWRVKLDPKWRISQLYVNGERRLRPFLPRKSYFKIGAKFGTPPGVRPTRFYARAGDLPAIFNEIDRVEFCVFHYWSMSRVPMKAYDSKTRLVTLTGGVSRPGNCDLTDEFWYRLDNVREALGEVPGEWYQERNGTLVYVPRKGETLKNTEIVAPRLERIVNIEGTSDVTFKNIVFAHALWNMPPEGHAARQAENGQGTWAVGVVRSKNIVFDGCVFRNHGGGGLEFGRAAVGCIARNCEFFDLGSGGVHVGPGQEVGKPQDSSLDFAKTKREDYAFGCMVTNCLIVSGGRVQPGAVGVWITHAPRTRVVGNTIRDFYYSGVSVGWKWALGENSTWSNEISDNVIGQIGQGVLSDLGGIYNLGTQPGTVFRGNYIYDVTSSRYGAYSIYFDSGSGGLSVSNNLVRGGDVSWFMARISASNRVENNVFLDAKRYPLCPLQRTPDSSPSVVCRNIICWQDGSLMPEARGRDTIVCTGNFCRRGKSRLGPVYAGFSESENLLIDKGGRQVEIPSSSPAVAGGFKPFSLDAAGCRQQSRTRKLPAPPAVFPPAPPKDEKVFSEDFELIEAGAQWKVWDYHPVSAPCTVSDERAASGRKSFCVVDNAKGYGPWLETFVYRSSGKASVSFDLLMEKGARPHFETRDSDAICLARGPFLAVDEDGRFRAANGAVLGEAVYGKWIHVEFECELGRSAPKTYKVRLAVEGEKAARVFENQWMHPEFHSFAWFGFLGLSQGGERYFVDNFKISPPDSGMAR